MELRTIITFSEPRLDFSLINFELAEDDMNKIIEIFVLIFFSAGVADASLNGPLPILWDTVWTIPTADRGTTNTYLQKRSSQGFDAVMMGIADWVSCAIDRWGMASLLFNGTVTNGFGDIMRPNENRISIHRLYHRKSRQLGTYGRFAP